MSKTVARSAPLFVDIGDRRCRWVYLLIVHLLVLGVVLFSSIALQLLYSLVLVVFLSGAYWCRRELFDDHPCVLKWNPTLGWRLGQGLEDLPVTRIRFMQTPFCLLLEVHSDHGVETLLLRNRANLNRLRYLLRRSSNSLGPVWERKER